MANRLRCPLCGRNVRYSNNARKVVRHHQIRLVDELKYDLATKHTILEAVPRYGPLCQVSGMKESEVRKLRLTVEAFRPSSSLEIPDWFPREPRR